MEKIDYEVPTKLRQEFEEENKKAKFIFGTSNKEPHFDINEGFKHRLKLYPNYCEIINGEPKMFYVDNIVVFDTKKEAIKFISTISFKEDNQMVKMWKKHRKWVVCYLTQEED